MSKKKKLFIDFNAAQNWNKKHFFLLLFHLRSNFVTKENSIFNQTEKNDLIAVFVLLRSLDSVIHQSSTAFRIIFSHNFL